MIDFTKLKNTYNAQIDQLLSETGLSTLCHLHSPSVNTQCPNCLYDSALKKSANAYKNGGPIPFNNGQICPYCNGVGIKKEKRTVSIYMGVLWDYKSWVIKPINIENPNGYIQTICSKDYIGDILKAENMSVNLSGPIYNPLFQLDGEPNPAGLGDNRYIVSQWKKIRK